MNGYLRKLAVFVVLLSPMAASAGYIEITVQGEAYTCIALCDIDPFEPGSNAASLPISGTLRLEFSESNWVDEWDGIRSQFPTLHSYDFDWSAVRIWDQTTLAVDSCETGDGFGLWWASSTIVEDSSGPDVQYYFSNSFDLGRFFCYTPTSMMTVEISTAEELYAEFYSPEYPWLMGGTNHNMSYSVGIMPDSEYVAEPGTLGLLALGLAGMVLARRRKEA